MSKKVYASLWYKLPKDTLMIDRMKSNPNIAYAITNCKLYRSPHSHDVILIPKNIDISDSDLLFEGLLNSYKNAIDNNELELLNPEEIEEDEDDFEISFDDDGNITEFNTLNDKLIDLMCGIAQAEGYEYQKLKQLLEAAVEMDKVKNDE